MTRFVTVPEDMAPALMVENAALKAEIAQLRNRLSDLEGIAQLRAAEDITNEEIRKIVEKEMAITDPEGVQFGKDWARPQLEVHIQDRIHHISEANRILNVAGFKMAVTGSFSPFVPSSPDAQDHGSHHGHRPDGKVAGDER